MCVHTETVGDRRTPPGGDTVPPSIHKSMFNPLTKRPGRGEGGPGGGAGYETIRREEVDKRERGNPQNKPPLVKASPPCCYSGTASEEEERRRGVRERGDNVAGNAKDVYRSRFWG